MSQTAHTFKQTLQDVTVTVPMKPGTRAKMLAVKIGPSTVDIRALDGTPVLCGDLFAPILVDDSTWSVEDQKELIVTLEKSKHEWWPHVLTSDPKIDVTKLEPERTHLSDLDSETRATVEKMMFDQQQKQKGLPTSDDLQKQKMLSNFKAQHPELDFSQLKDENINYRG